MTVLLDLVQEFEMRAQHMLQIIGRQRRTIQRGCLLHPPAGIIYGGETRDVATQTD